MKYILSILKVIPLLFSWLREHLACVRFAFPLDHNTVSSNEIMAIWRYRWLLGMKLAVFHVDGFQYWPQGSPIINPTNKRLEKKVTIENQRGKPYVLIIASVSDDFLVAIKYYVQVKDTLQESHQIDQYIPIVIHPHQMPPGLRELDRVTVTLT